MSPKLRRRDSDEGPDDVAYAKRLLKICDVAAGLPEADRPSFIEAICEGDIQLREDLSRLFRSLNEAGDFLEHGPLRHDVQDAD